MSIIPAKLIDQAKKCPCKVCRTLVGSSHYNREVLIQPDQWELAALAKKQKQRETGKC